MAEQELDLLQFATALVAQASACPTEVMRRDIAQIARLARLLYNAPDDLGTETMGANPPGFVDRAEDRAIGDLRLRYPALQRSRNPKRDWDGTNMISRRTALGALLRFILDMTSFWQWQAFTHRFGSAIPQKGLHTITPGLSANQWGRSSEEIGATSVRAIKYDMR